jgi:predicted TIM-barrel fold metal-dependent hydrolase
VRRVFGEPAASLTGTGIDQATLIEIEAHIAARGPATLAPRSDVHVHLGRDRDGHHSVLEDVVAEMDRWQVERAAVFALNDPGPGEDFVGANDAVLAAASRYPGRLVPVCRVNPRSAALAEIERAGDAGARGLKLHPVAQRVAPESPESLECIEAAAVRGWPVVIHAGFGARPLAHALSEVAARVPTARLVLAHGARGDARAVRDALSGHPGVWFDTSLAALPDLVDLPPERLVFGSDRPYGDYATGLQLVGEAARISGWSAAQVADVMSGNFAALFGDVDAPD